MQKIKKQESKQAENGQQIAEQKIQKYIQRMISENSEDNRKTPLPFEMESKNIQLIE